jgi:hypothetical protein
MIDGAEYVKTLSNPRDPNVLINDLVAAMYRIDISAASKAQLKRDILLAGQTTDIYWTQAWDLFISTPTNTNNATSVRNKVRDLIKYLMNLAEYQLS